MDYEFRHFVSLRLSYSNGLKFLFLHRENICLKPLLILEIC